MADATLTDNFGANDILWQLSVFACNISVMMCQKKNKEGGKYENPHERIWAGYVQVTQKVDKLSGIYANRTKDTACLRLELNKISHN